MVASSTWRVAPVPSRSRSRDRFAEAWAVDQEPEAVDFAARKATELGVRNVRWIAGRAEDVAPDEVFELVTVGTAFHRLDRERVAGLAVQWLRSGGHLALLWSTTPLNGTAPWQEVLATIVVDWMQRVGVADRVPADLDQHLTQLPHAAVLREAGFDEVEHYEFTADQRLDGQRAHRVRVFDVAASSRRAR